MTSIIRSLEDEIKQLGMLATQYDLGFNAGVNKAISVLLRYSDGEQCIFCGSSEVDKTSYACRECGFKGF